MLNMPGVQTHDQLITWSADHGASRPDDFSFRRVVLSFSLDRRQLHSWLSHSCWLESAYHRRFLVFRATHVYTGVLQPDILLAHARLPAWHAPLLPRTPLHSLNHTTAHCTAICPCARTPARLPTAWRTPTCPCLPASA